jgi:hypothetical protein
LVPSSAANQGDILYFPKLSPELKQLAASSSSSWKSCDLNLCEDDVVAFRTILLLDEEDTGVNEKVTGSLLAAVFGELMKAMKNGTFDNSILVEFDFDPAGPKPVSNISSSFPDFVISSLSFHGINFGSTTFNFKKDYLPILAALYHCLSLPSTMEGVKILSGVPPAYAAVALTFSGKYQRGRTKSIRHFVEVMQQRIGSHPNMLELKSDNSNQDQHLERACEAVHRLSEGIQEALAKVGFEVVFNIMNNLSSERSMFDPCNDKNGIAFVLDSYNFSDLGHYAQLVESVADVDDFMMNQSINDTNHTLNDDDDDGGGTDDGIPKEHAAFIGWLQNKPESLGTDSDAEHVDSSSDFVSGTFDSDAEDVDCPKYEHGTEDGGDTTDSATCDGVDSS